MIRHIIFPKSVFIANALLATGKCKNEGNWILSCEDTAENMTIIQDAFNVFIKSIKNREEDLQNYKLCFVNPADYSDYKTV